MLGRLFVGLLTDQVGNALSPNVSFPVWRSDGTRTHAGNLDVQSARFNDYIRTPRANPWTIYSLLIVISTRNGIFATNLGGAVHFSPPTWLRTNYSDKNSVSLFIPIPLNFQFVFSTHVFLLVPYTILTLRQWLFFWLHWRKNKPTANRFHISTIIWPIDGKLIELKLTNKRI